MNGFQTTESVSPAVKQAQIDMARRGMPKAEYAEAQRKKRNPRFKKTGKP